MAKQVKITKKNYDLLKDSVIQTYQDRKGSENRKDHEQIWNEVDRQVRLKPVPATKEYGSQDEDWHNEIEVGDLATASEVFTADVVRLAFGGDHWFLPHTDLSAVNMERNLKEKRQKAVDDDVRAFMTQQHKDFALRQSVKVSLKEIAHHGAMVATVEPARLTAMPVVPGGRSIHQLEAPTWRPHSMWNCFPDTNPAVIGTRFFYDGSMIIRSYMKRQDVNYQDWMNKQKVIDNATKKGSNTVVEVITMYGPIFIPRKSSQDIYIPNGIVQIASNELVKAVASPWPYPNVIYTGYERVDARDPYYFSPLMKHSPMQTLASRAANKFMDSVDIQVEPPVIYNKNAPGFADEPPPLAPRQQIAVGAGGDLKEMKLGNPEAALEGLKYAKDELKIGLGVDANRAGVDASVEQTAEEIRLKNARSEVRLVDFLADFENQALKPFLYMQHEWNKNNLKPYAYFNPEVGIEDHKLKQKGDLPEDIIFEIVGSKDVLGEQRRATQLLAVTQAVMNIPGMAERLDQNEILKDLYRDAGARTKAELYIKTPSEEEQEVIDAEILRLQNELKAFAEAAQKTEDDFQAQLRALKQETDNANKESMRLNTQVEQQKLKLSEKDLQIEQKQAEVDNEKTEKQSLVEERRTLNQKIQLQQQVFAAAEKLQQTANKAKEQEEKERDKTLSKINDLKVEFHTALSEEGSKDDVMKVLERVNALIEEVSKPKSKSIDGQIGDRAFKANVQEK